MPYLASNPQASMLAAEISSNGGSWQSSSTYNSYSIDATQIPATTPTPEPSALALAGLGFAALAVMRRHVILL